MTDEHRPKKKRNRRPNPHAEDGFCLNRPTYKGRNGKKSRSPHWHIRFRDHGGLWRRLTAFTDRSATVAFARKLRQLTDLRAADKAPEDELARWVDGLADDHRRKLIAWGVLDQRASMGTKPLSEHINDWLRSVLADGPTTKHVNGLRTKVERLIADCGFTRFSDIDELAVQEQLASQSLSRQTKNHYITAVRQFTTWMTRHGRASSSPVSGLKKGNAQADRRYERRSLTIEELRRLIQAAERGSDYLKTTGRERGLIYAFAATTGLRAAEIKSLTCGSFDLDNLTVTVEAKSSKRRRKDVVPLTADVVARLRAHLAAKLPTAPAFNLPEKTAKMMRVDLTAANIPYRIERDKVVDFHSLRVTFITNLARSGVHPRVAQTLARHSSVNLTMNVYSEVRGDDKRAALASLPNLSAAG